MSTFIPTGNWLLYGATGQTGTLIAEEAVRRGHRPVLAGRDAGRLRLLAERLGLAWSAFTIAERDTLKHELEGVELVLNAASPFAETSTPLMECCIASRCHYLDISNEIAILKNAQTRQHIAAERAVVIMPGVGFGTVASSALASHLCQRVDRPVSLEIAISPFVRHKSPGATKSTLGAIAQGAYVRRNGVMVATRFGAGAKVVRFGNGEQCVVPVPSGDLEAAYMATGIDDITVYISSPLGPVLSRLALPLVQKLLSKDGIRQRLVRIVERRKPETDAHEKEGDERSWLWAKITGRTGDHAEAWLETGEGYTFTASAAIKAIEWVLAHRPAGVATPALFGSDFILQLPGVRRHDAAPKEA